MIIVLDTYFQIKKVILSFTDQSKIKDDMNKLKLLNTLGLTLGVVILQGCSSDLVCLNSPYLYSKGNSSGDFCTDKAEGFDGKRECSTAPFNIQAKNKSNSYCKDANGNHRFCQNSAFPKLHYVGSNAYCENEAGKRECTSPNHQAFGPNGSVCVAKEYPGQALPAPSATPTPSDAVPSTGGVQVSAGVNLGGINSGTTTSLAPTATAGHAPEAGSAFPAGGGSMDCNSPMGGVQFAVEMSVSSRFYAGAELAASKTNNNCNRVGATPAIGAVVAGVSNQTVNLKSTGTASGILGMTFGEKFSVYGKGGFAAANADIQSDLSLGGGSLFTTGTFNDSLTGYVAGVGFTYDISNQLSAGLEYQHFDFGKNTFTSQFLDSGAPRTDGLISTAKLDADALTLKANYQFNS